MIVPGRVVIEITCLKTGRWSQLPYKCIPACPESYVSFNSSKFFVSWILWFVNDSDKLMCLLCFGCILNTVNKFCSVQFLSGLDLRNKT